MPDEDNILNHPDTGSTNDKNNDNINNYTNDKINDDTNDNNAAIHASIYDRAFRMMLERMPWIVIPLINEVFGTSYSEDENVTQYRNELFLKSRQNISDSILGIKDKLYHVECQSTPDSAIAIRMIQYDFVIALDNAEKISENGAYAIDFPNSCVLYLRSTKNTPDKAQVRINLPDGQTFVYGSPIVKAQNYTSEEIFKERLFMLLPYYILRYERQLENIANDTEKLNGLLDEYVRNAKKLKTSLSESGRSECYEELMGIITKISEYVLRRNESVKERMQEIMYRDDLIKLPSDYREEGRAEERAKAQKAYKNLRDKMQRLGYREEDIEMLTADLVCEPSSEYGEANTDSENN